MNMDEGRSKRQATSDELNLPKNIKYKIRVDIDNVPSTSLLRGRSVHCTYLLLGFMTGCKTTEDE